MPVENIASLSDAPGAGHSGGEVGPLILVVGSSNTDMIITMSARGALVAGEDLRQLIPAFKVKAVDTAAAGDTFNGALAAGLAVRLVAVRGENCSPWKSRKFLSVLH